jgi:hypothetical protein
MFPSLGTDIGAILRGKGRLPRYMLLRPALSVSCLQRIIGCVLHAQGLCGSPNEGQTGLIAVTSLSSCPEPGVVQWQLLER